MSQSSFETLYTAMRTAWDHVVSLSSEAPAFSPTDRAHAVVFPAVLSTHGGAHGAEASAIFEDMVKDYGYPRAVHLASKAFES